LHPSGAFFIIDNKNLKLFDIYIKKRYYIKYKALKIKKIGENKVKKSTIAKFLLGTMVLPTALAGNCKADPVKLEVPYLMNVLKHLPNIDDRRKFIKASRNAGDAFHRNYLLDLTSFGTDYNHLDDNTKRLLIRNLIKDYCGKYGDNEGNCTDEVKGTVAISYGNFRDRSTVPIMIEELLNEEVVKKLKNRIGVVYIDKFYDLIEYTFNRHILYNNIIKEYKEWDREKIKIVEKTINTFLQCMIIDFNDLDTAIYDLDLRFQFGREKYQFIWNLCEKNKQYLMMKQIINSLNSKNN